MAKALKAAEEDDDENMVDEAQIKAWKKDSPPSRNSLRPNRTALPRTSAARSTA